MTKRPRDYQTFFAELKRRNVFKVTAAYGVVAFVVLQAADLLVEGLQLSQDVLSTITVVVILGFPIALVLAWAYDLAPGGMQRAAPAESGELEAIVAQPAAKRWPAGLLALAGVVLFAGGIWWVMKREPGVEPVATLDPTMTAVAVLPYRASGGELAVWHEGLMDVLAANLDGVGDLRVIDTRTVMSHWRGRFGEEDPPAESAVRLAADLGARWAVHGQAVELGGQIRIDSRIFDAQTGEQLASTSVAGPPDSMLALTEGMTLDLLREMGAAQDMGDQGRAFTSTSIDAVRSYLEGVQSMRRSDWDSAIESLNRALEIDSTFAMAAARLSESYGWKYSAGHALVIEATEHAARFADKLPARDRDLLQLRRVFEQGRAAEALDLAQRMTSRYPTDPEAWFELGEVQHHLDTFLGTTYAQQMESFERALALDSTFVSPLMHLMDLNQRVGDFDAFERYVELYLSIDSTSIEASSRRRVLAIVRGSPADSLAAVESLSSADYAELRQTMLASYFNPSMARFAGRVAYELSDSRHPVRQREGGWRFWVNLTEIWRGRPAAAGAALDSAEALGTNLRSVAYYRLQLLAHGLGDTTRTADALRLGEETGLFQTPTGRWALGAYHLYNDQLGEVAASADALDIIADSLLSAGDSLQATTATALGQGLRGLLAARRGEFEDAVSILRASVIQSSGLGGEWMPVNDQRLALAIALAELGRDEEALAILNAAYHGSSYTDGPSSLLRGQLYERRGEREQAIRAYSRVVELWRDCEPDFVPRREVAERALERLLAQG